LLQVDALRMWAKTAESDLIIAEALLGSSLGPLTTLGEALAAALLPPRMQQDDSNSSIGDAGSAAGACTGGSSSSCLPVLTQPVSAALLDQLQAARGLATCMSPAVKQLAAQVRYGMIAKQLWLQRIGYSTARVKLLCARNDCACLACCAKDKACCCIDPGLCLCALHCQCCAIIYATAALCWLSPLALPCRLLMPCMFARNFVT
jgi:hypothetical protein